MGVWAITMVRDEADIVASTVAHMLDEVDRVLVADNLSTDATPEILAELVDHHGDRLRVVPDLDPAYRQSAKMTELAQLARHLWGEGWVVPFDADEWWYSPFGRIADVLEGVPERHHVVPAALYDHVATGLDPEHPDPIRRIGWRRPDPAPLPKVAARLRPDLVIEQGNHGAHFEAFEPGRFDSLLVVRHFPYRSVEQLVRKVRNGAAAYRAAPDLPAEFGSHWRSWGDLLDSQGEEAIAELFRRWYWRANPGKPLTIEGERQPALLYDPAP